MKNIIILLISIYMFGVNTFVIDTAALFEASTIFLFGVSLVVITSFSRQKLFNQKTDSKIY